VEGLGLWYDENYGIYFLLERMVGLWLILWLILRLMDLLGS